MNFSVDVDCIKSWRMVKILYLSYHCGICVYKHLVMCSISCG